MSKTSSGSILSAILISGSKDHSRININKDSLTTQKFIISIWTVALLIENICKPRVSLHIIYIPIILNQPLLELYSILFNTLTCPNISCFCNNHIYEMVYILI